ncbi:hypothetical protein Nepgr_027212 [Nepenthes gracilis]|uniref:Uncharacterized protein n=1 Tax=Nepenthes gracilis TaxID=150966 RepID=A0AAD3TAE8_NEPGR|nr:hypothetical protein Nepgr_027212 [Nepenthes gracilis]
MLHGLSSRSRQSIASTILDSRHAELRHRMHYSGSLQLQHHQPIGGQTTISIFKPGSKQAAVTPSSKVSRATSSIKIHDVNQRLTS